MLFSLYIKGRSTCSREVMNHRASWSFYRFNTAIDRRHGSGSKPATHSLFSFGSSAEFVGQSVEVGPGAIVMPPVFPGNRRGGNVIISARCNPALIDRATLEVIQPALLVAGLGKRLRY